jgi:hypothetical protein
MLGKPKVKNVTQMGYILLQEEFRKVIPLLFS